MSFEGHEGRECGEHRTLGKRAWCYDCSTYCYPAAPCPRCELPMLRAAAEQVDLTARELAWWTLPTAPPDELTKPARDALRELRRVLPPLPPGYEPE